MSEQPEVRVERGPVTQNEAFAIGMAELLEREGKTIAAAELRRLSIENDALGLHLSERMKDLARVEAQRDALLEALKAFANEIVPNNPNDPLWVKARAAIKAVEGENHAKNL